MKKKYQIDWKKIRSAYGLALRSTWLALKITINELHLAYLDSQIRLKRAQLEELKEKHS